MNKELKKYYDEFHTDVNNEYCHWQDERTKKMSILLGDASAIMLMTRSFLNSVPKVKDPYLNEKINEWLEKKENFFSTGELK